MAALTGHTVVRESFGLRDIGGYVLGGVTVLVAVGPIRIRRRGANVAPAPPLVVV